MKMPLPRPSRRGHPAGGLGFIYIYMYLYMYMTEGKNTFAQPPEPLLSALPFAFV